MSTDELRDLLAERAGSVDVSRTSDVSRLHANIRTARRRRAAATTLGAAGIAAAVIVGGLALTSTDDKADGPVKDPTQTPTVTFEIPSGQQTIVADIGPGDVRGFEVLAEASNAQPEHRNDTSLSATVTAHTEYATGYYMVQDCRAHDVPTWIAYKRAELGWAFRECSSDDPFSLALHADLPDATFVLLAGEGEQETAQVVAIAPPSVEQQACLESNDPGSCDVQAIPIAETDAEFGFRLYEHKPAGVLRVFEDDGDRYLLEALSSINEVGWLADRAVLAKPDAERLALELPAGDTDYLIDVYDTSGPHFDRCLVQHEDELDFEHMDRGDYEAAVDRLCYAKLRLVVDGEPIRADKADIIDKGHFTDLGARLSPGAVHRIEVEIVRGDPRNIRYAVVVRTQTQLP